MKQYRITSEHFVAPGETGDADAFIDPQQLQELKKLAGLPFNIASTALFTYIIAKVCGYNLREIALSLCDCHIYEEHLEAVDIQLNRTPTLFPQIKINKDIDINISIDEKIKWIEELKFEDFELINYNPQPTIKAPMK